MTETRNGAALAPGEGEELVVGGTRATMKLSGREPGSPFEAFEVTTPPRFPGPPLHRHRTYDETFSLLDGAMTLRLGERTVEATAGSFVFVPRGTPHTYANPADRPVRFLLLVSPGGIEAYYRDMAAAIAREGGMPSRETFARLYARHDTELV